ncbi:MAG TPA: IPT/TIG domain-containing protein, partial [Verrucomicrobiota bacterium]|nr:IPT/TIG domain-containing protein [Verrucomicrobiota bacterium]
MSQLGRLFHVGCTLFLLLLGFSAYAQPRITNYAPGEGPPGTVVNIVGTGLIGPGFIPGTGLRVLVLFNGPGTGASAQIISASTTLLRVIVPESARSGPISVYTSQGQTSTLPFGFFLPPKVIDFGTEYNDFNQFVKPVVGEPGQTLRIEGENFLPPRGNVVVRVGGRLFSRAVLSDSQIDVFLGVPAANGPIETGPVSVATVVGTNVTSTFVYGQPFIATFTPKAEAGSPVSITGFNLKGRLPSEITVEFGGVPATQLNLISNTNLTAIVPPTALSGSIRLSAPGGAFITTSNFTVLPHITSFTPNFGPAGTVVTINGSGLNGTTQVRFGNAVAAAYTNISQLQVTAVAPNNVPTGPIMLITTNGTNTSTELFYGVPRVESINPTSGNPGTIVTVSGANFTGATQVQMNGVAVPGFLVVNNQSIT